MPRKCAKGSCKKVAILKRPKTAVEPEVLPEESNGRRLYGQYSQDNLEKAIKAVKEDNMSCCKAAKEFAVPRSTLKNYLSQRSLLGVKPGRKRSIPEEIENDLVDKAIAAAEAGFPLTKKEFLLRVEKTVHEKNLDTQFKNGVPGNDYWRAVKTRRPDLVTGIRKSDNTNINMKKSLKVDTVSKYFDELEKVLTELDLFVRPECIWNADELGIQYCAEPVKILPKRGTQDLASKVGIIRETNLAVLCVSALGQAMPPLFLANKGEVRTMQKFSIQNSSHGTVWTLRESTWSNEQIMTEWFKDVFLKNCGSSRPQILIMNNHGSQEMPELLEVAKRERIHIMALPPRTSPWLEPLDRGIFLPFQKACRKFTLRFLADNPTLTVNYDSWPNIVCQVWNEVMTSEVIMRAFEVTGIYPLNRGKIPQEVVSSLSNLSESTPEDPIEQFKMNNGYTSISNMEVLSKIEGSVELKMSHHSHQQTHHHAHLSLQPHQNFPNHHDINIPLTSDPPVQTQQMYSPLTNPSFSTHSDTSVFHVFNS